MKDNNPVSTPWLRDTSVDCNIFYRRARWFNFCEAQVLRSHGHSYIIHTPRKPVSVRFYQETRNFCETTNKHNYLHYHSSKNIYVILSRVSKFQHDARNVSQCKKVRNKRSKRNISTQQTQLAQLSRSLCYS